MNRRARPAILIPVIVLVIAAACGSDSAESGAVGADARADVPLVFDTGRPGDAAPGPDVKPTPDADSAPDTDPVPLWDAVTVTDTVTDTVTVTDTDTGTAPDTGTDTDVRVDWCNPDPCNGHGICKGGECICAPGYEGLYCERCEDGYLGWPDCAATCAVDEDRVRDNLHAKWDIDFDGRCNTYLTTMISGPDYVVMVPADPAAPVRTFYGNANQNMGYAAVVPVPEGERAVSVVALYSCCSGCACQAANGATMLYTCAADEPDCPCAGQSNCPGFLNFPFLRAGYGQTGIPYNGAWVVTPTGVTAGFDGSGWVGNFQAERCWGFGTCTACDPDHPDEWCVPDLSPCCDTTPLGRLARFTLPGAAGPDAAPRWRVAHIFEGEQIANLATARDGTLRVATLVTAGKTGRLWRYDGESDEATLVAEFEAGVFSLAQEPGSGDWYLEVQASPRIRRLSADGAPLPLPETVPADPAGDGVLQIGPDRRLYRLVGRTQADAGLDVWDLP